jgi:hypothetical protein
MELRPAVPTLFENVGVAKDDADNKVHEREHGVRHSTRHNNEEVGSVGRGNISEGAQDAQDPGSFQIRLSDIGLESGVGARGRN